MAYLGTEKLRELIAAKDVIVPNNNRIVCGAYELALGNEVFRTDSTEKKKEFLDRENEQVVINPGQFALLLLYMKISLSLRLDCDGVNDTQLANRPTLGNFVK